MKTRLALVACTESAKGPWLRSRGNETGMRVQNLEDGSHIVCWIDVAGIIQSHAILNADGVWPVPEKWDRISFAKHCESAGLPTQIELLIA